jgi:hypothetical protein
MPAPLLKNFMLLWPKLRQRAPASMIASSCDGRSPSLLALLGEIKITEQADQSCQDPSPNPRGKGSRAIRVFAPWNART